MKYIGAFDHGVDQENPENDRFTTNWKGPYDPRAISHAAKKGISYHGEGSIYQMSPGTFRMTGGGGTDIIYLQNKNQAHDDEIRSEHARDIDITTGTTDAAICGWDLATRGQKLRSCAKSRALCTTKQDEQQVKKDWLEKALQNNPESTVVITQLKVVNNNIKNILQIGALNDLLEQLVLDETKQDWDWKTGIPAQIEIVKKQAELDFVDL